MDSVTPIDEAEIINAILPAKDVDGFVSDIKLNSMSFLLCRLHSFNAGELAKK